MKEKLTILHSNDIHGDFLEKEENGKKKGGLARLSGYVNTVRLQEKNVIYAVAGDMFRGSIMDSEYRGMSTLELMNLLWPDVVCLGNHEVDYGVTHALFVEKCANFPLINANLMIASNWTRLMAPFYIMKCGGLKIMFISVATKETLDGTKKDPLVNFYLEVSDYAETIGMVCDLYKPRDVNCVILLTHIGLEEDRILAEKIRPEWGVNLIIGGHSHTFMKEPVYVNGVPIVQAGTGSAQIGRAEMVVDSETGKTESFQWELVPVGSDTCEENVLVKRAIEYLKADIGTIYDRIICVLAKQLTHPARNRETQIGNLLTDLLLKGFKLDIVLMGSGTIRKKSLGPVVTVKDLKETYPFVEEYYVLRIKGSQLQKMFRFVFREEAFKDNADTEFYQISAGCRFVWSRGKQEFLEFSLNGSKIEDDRILEVALQSFHLQNFEKFFNLPLSEVEANGKPRIIATGVYPVLEELLANTKSPDASIEGRIDIRD